MNTKCSILSLFYRAFAVSLIHVHLCNNSDQFADIVCVRFCSFRANVAVSVIDQFHCFYFVKCIYFVTSGCALPLVL